jgi:hypothetical protein
VATSTGVTAVGALHAAHSLGATVPDRLSVVGYDDILIASHTVPALTTLRMPIAEIVAHAVALAVALAREPEASRVPALEVFKPSLIVRESTAAPASGRDGRSRRTPGSAGDPHRIASARRLAQAKYGTAPADRPSAPASAGPGPPAGPRTTGTATPTTTSPRSGRGTAAGVDARIGLGDPDRQLQVQDGRVPGPPRPGQLGVAVPGIAGADGQAGLPPWDLGAEVGGGVLVELDPGAAAGRQVLLQDAERPHQVGRAAGAGIAEGLVAVPAAHPAGQVGPGLRQVAPAPLHGG